MCAVRRIVPGTFPANRVHHWSSEIFDAASAKASTERRAERVRGGLGIGRLHGRIRSRMTSIAGIVALTLLSAAHAQQSPEPTGEAIGHPPRFPVRRPFLNLNPELKLHRLLPSLGQASRRPKVIPGHTSPLARRRRRTPKVRQTRDRTRLASKTSPLKETSRLCLAAWWRKKPMDLPPASEYLIKAQSGEVTRADARWEFAPSRCRAS